MKSILSVVSLVILTSCGASYYLKRAEVNIRKAEQLGAKVTQDTVYKTVEVPEVKIDTLVEKVNFLDTIYVTKNRVVTKVKIDVKDSTVYVETKCPPVKLEVPVAVNRDIKAGYTLFNVITYSLLALGLGYLIKSLR